MTRFSLKSSIALIHVLAAGITSAVTIDSADLEVLPQGSPITLTGSGFSDVTRATFFWNGLRTEAGTREISDTVLEVDFTPMTVGLEHMLYLETATGSTITSRFTADQVAELQVDGLYSNEPPQEAKELLVIKSGGIFQGFSAETPPVSLIYVEAGGAIQSWGDLGDILIFAESGASLDFRGGAALGDFGTRLYYSTGTEILGSLPTAGVGAPYAEEVPPLSLSLGVGPFTRGFELQLEIEGPGSVARSNTEPYYKSGTEIELTAQAEPGKFFNGWSGAVTSANPTITVEIPNDKIVASFSAGRILETYSGLGGQIIRVPDKEFYTDEEMVTLSPQAADGFEFLGWGGDVLAIGNSLELEMGRDFKIIGIFRSLSQDQLPQITGVDPEVLVDDVTMTFSGSRLDGPTKATFFSRTRSQEVSFQGVSDTTLRLESNALLTDRRYNFLVETAVGSTLTVSSDPQQNGSFQGIGMYPGDKAIVVIEPGSILTGFSTPTDIPGDTEVIYVKAGGVLQMGPFAEYLHIFAEDGAILDFQFAQPIGVSSPTIFYSPNTEIRGEIPEDPFEGSPVRQISSLALSPGIGPFSRAFQLNLEIEGPGSVTRSIAGPYYDSGAEIELTAQAEPGMIFNGWSGSVTSVTPTITVEIPNAEIIANFSAGRILETYSGPGGQVIRVPDKEVYADEEMVTLTPQAADGFEFLGWGGDVSAVENSLELEMGRDFKIIGIFRSLTQDQLPQITGVDPEVLSEDITMTFSGSGLGGPTKATFFSGTRSQNASFQGVSDTTLQVDFNLVLASRRNHLMVETVTGSTLTVSSDPQQTGSFQGVGMHPGDKSVVVVEPGSILTGFSTPTDIPGDTEVIYVRAGGVLQMRPFAEYLHVFAEDGAILDFQFAQPIGVSSPTIFYSPKTEIRGEIPEDPFEGSPVRQVASLSLSPGIGPFSEGSELNLTVIGSGVIARNIPGPYYNEGTMIALTAQAAPGFVFAGWSGSVTSTDLTITVQAPINEVIATFETGKILTTTAGPGGRIVRNPEKEAYSTGEIVTLTAQADLGFAFVGWEGDASGSQNPLEITIDGDSDVIATFAEIGQGLEPRITEVDHEIIPVGSTMTLTGTELVNVTRASFLWSQLVTEAAFRSISATSLEVDYAAGQASREHMLLVETTAGSTITTAGLSTGFGSFSGDGLYSGNERVITIESGAVFKGFATSTGGYSTDIIYVKAGGVLEVGFYVGRVLVFAEDGAVLDYRGGGAPSTGGIIFYHSPNTEILGEVPTGFGGNSLAKEITSVSLSPGVGPFTEGFELDLIIEGTGTVTRDIPGPYYERGALVELSAEPGEGQFFTGWSGSVTSTALTVTAPVLNTPIVATFSSGRILTTYSGRGGQIIRSPDKAVYEDGETVILTPQAATGFEFLGWGGEVMSFDDSLDLTMNQNLEVVGIFRSLGQDSLPQITSADYEFIPEGETITLSGSGLTGSTKASFIWSGQRTEGAVREVSDSSVEVDYQAWQAIREHMLLLETVTGSTITTEIEADEFGHFDGVGTYAGSEKVIVVEPGAILEGVSDPSGPQRIEVIYVKAGAVLKFGAFTNMAAVFAEEGAILDFRALSPINRFSTIAYYSPNTEIIGEIPTGFNQLPMAQMVAPISISPGVGPFTEGVALDLSVVGAGSVTRSIPGPYYKAGAAIELTAEPEAGQFFTGWTGTVTSISPTITVQASSAPIIASFSSGRILTTYSGLGGQVIRTPEKDVYFDGETVTLTYQAEAGFEFLGWGGDVSSVGESLEFTMSQNTEIVGVFRSLTQDTLPRITEADFESLPIGETITLSGSILTGPTKASFIWKGQTTEAPVRGISNSSLEVDYAAWQASRDHMLLLETSTGSTFTHETEAADFGRFEGVGEYAGAERVVTVEAGAILSGFANPNASFLVDLIYVKAGGVLKLGSFTNRLHVFAEDGAILDFRGEVGSGFFGSTAFYYSPKTEILGEIPTTLSNFPLGKQVAPLSISPGVGSFTEAYRVTLVVEGPGSVAGFDETVTYFKRGDAINLTATPTVGNYFIRWTGSVPSTQRELNVVVGREMMITARFSSLVDFVSDWRGQNFTPEQLADPAIAGLNADPDNDGNDNTTEYVFGGNPLEADNGAEVVFGNVNLQERSIEFSYVRPRFIADVEYRYLGSSDLTLWTALSELGAIDEVSTEATTDKLERVRLKVTFTEELPASYSIRIAADLQ